MASKVYTAQEMRTMADKEKFKCSFVTRTLNGGVILDCTNDVRDMLRQAADAMEREERRKSSTTTDYSFVDESGFRVSYLYDSVETAKRRAIELGYNAKYFIRREVGEWEEVNDER